MGNADGAGLVDGVSDGDAVVGLTVKDVAVGKLLGSFVGGFLIGCALDGLGVGKLLAAAAACVGGLFIAFVGGLGVGTAVGIVVSSRAFTDGGRVGDRSIA